MSVNHGLSKTPEHKAWRAMIDRCHNPKSAAYNNYGGRGITVCDEWRASFVAFFNHIGFRPGSKYSIDRIDNSKGYFPGNVRWATWSQQAQNKRGLQYLTYEGETLCIREWSRRVGLERRVISRRILAGWPVERVLTEPKGTRYSPHNNPIPIEYFESLRQTKGIFKPFKRTMRRAPAHPV